MTCNFTSWYEKVCDCLQKQQVLAEIDQTFIRSKNDKDRINVISNYSNHLDILIKESFKTKSNKISEEHRLKGNSNYGKGKFNHALEAYSQSISFAERQTKELGLAYANRSAVLFSMNKFELCYDDIEQAFKNNYPSSLSYKLHERKSICCKHMKRFEEASECVRQCLHSLKISSIDDAKKQQCKKRILKAAESLDLNPGVQLYKNNNLIFKNAVYTNVMPKLLSANKTYPCATDSFKITHDIKKGRYAVASKVINPGEVIIIEKPFTSICIASAFDTHCYKCFTRFIVSYPCRQCASVNFCSVECEEQSWHSFHQFECKYMDYLILDDIGLGHLALKMVSSLGIDSLNSFEQLQQEKKVEEDIGLNTQQKFESTDYCCVYSLVGNSNQRQSADLFRRALIAIYLCKILKRAGFFKSSDMSLQISNEKMVSSHLLKQLQMLPCNAHEVSELQLKGTEVANAVLKEIGSAVYPTLSLLNHSCDPSVVRHCYGETCVLRSIKRINIGEEIIDNYGFLYPVEDKPSRIKHLKEQYYFTCQCIPCLEKWPLYNDIPDEQPSLICLNCKSLRILNTKLCLNCQYVDDEIASFESVHEQFQACMKDVLDTGNVADNLDLLLRYLNMISEKAVLPTLQFNNCQEIVKLCFSLQGNYVKI